MSRFLLTNVILPYFTDCATSYTFKANQLDLYNIFLMVEVIQPSQRNYVKKYLI